MTASITERPFGSFENNPVKEYTLTNENGMQVSIINYGATITRIITPDKNAEMGNVITGFDSIDGYLRNSDKYIGSIVGRYCNRIANAGFSLDGVDFSLAANNNSNSLHGGLRGFDKVWWNIEPNEIENSLILTYFSKDGEEGFPGNLHVEITYKLYPDNALAIDYTAVTDRATPVNLTSHCYFNLSAGKSNNILDHELLLFAEKYTALDNHSIPTGELLTVKNSPYDFSLPKKVGKDIGVLSSGYDNNFVLNGSQGKAAVLYDPLSGRCMELFTTEPGLQFYTANFLNLDNTAIEHSIKYPALCLEAQNFPNSPNEKSFPDSILRPGSTYRQTTVHKFSAK